MSVNRSETFPGSSVARENTRVNCQCQKKISSQLDYLGYDRMAFCVFKFIVSGVVFGFIGSGVNCRKSDEYDHFVYTQQWPQSVCACVNGLNIQETCKIREGIHTWTIHGLWPTLGDSEKPDYCNDSWHFKLDKIADIESEMKMFWPALIFSSNSDSYTSFWKHEWVKHGTCCTNKPSLDSEHKYFEKGLELNIKYNLLSMLGDAGIVPSNTKSYQLSNIRDAIEKRLGHKPYFNCCKTNFVHSGMDDKYEPDDRQRVQEVMICLNKQQLRPIDCDHTGDENCAEEIPIYYEPMTPSIYV